MGRDWPLGRSTVFERVHDGDAEGNDHFAERDDDDETVSFCHVSWSENPVTASGEGYRSNRDGGSRGPDCDADGSVCE